jgi:2,4-dienoyl-CoA reductase-like NADH-dependent reductase (Old Yellow Enzyme family)
MFNDLISEQSLSWLHSSIIVACFAEIVGAEEIGHAMVGVRLSPFGRLFDMAPFGDEPGIWVEVAREIQKRDIAYVHLSDQLTIGAECMPQGFATSFLEPTEAL